MKISIITATYNNETTISESLLSLYSQTYPKVEHIIIDGLSEDKTLNVIKNTPTKYQRIIISEKDNGIYDALNKGIKIATGEIIGILHADDMLANNDILEKIASIFKKENIDALYGDLVYIAEKNPQKIIRHWKSQQFHYKLLKKGWMPPHPTLFLRKYIYEKFGLFDTSFQISADYEFILRIFTANIKAFYIPRVIIKMRIGGTSNKSLNNIYIKMREDLKAIKKHQIGNINVLLKKNLSKIPQFFKSKKLISF